MRDKDSQEINEEMKQLVITRISAAPSNWKLSIGSYGSLSKEEMIEHIKLGDEIGVQIVKSHLSFIKAIANGEFTKALTSI